MPKTIAIFTDGTGNSARSLFKTNVWRVYQALDLTELVPEQPGKTRQIAYYQDGIGTSTFKPLAIIGGAFGYGLKRNVIDAYIYLCRTYEVGDRIFLFGFSRGGFTARVLLGLILSQGLLTCRTKVDLDRYGLDAYRTFRRGFKNRMGPFVTFLRNRRDWVIARWRRWRNQPLYETVQRANVTVTVKFIGVWDTVSAYGLPIAELTRGIDHWVWPLSLPDNQLPAGAEIARHALSLDDEREAFHPLLWDEINSPDPQRILQVWFAGVHADVGGGYPHDGLALFPLAWMMREAVTAGLRFRDGVLAEIDGRLSHSVPMHDSRQLFGAYYRYQPRRIGALIDPPDADTLAMRNTSLNGRGLLKKVNVHETVFERIKSGPDPYAPIGLPDCFTIVGNAHTLPGAAQRIAGQPAIWDLVWWKRIVYFATLLSALALLIYPLFAESDATCESPPCLLVPVVSGIASVMPLGIRSWGHGFGAAPTLCCGLALILAILLWLSHHLHRVLHDEMRQLWDQAFALDACQSQPAVADHADKPWDNPLVRLLDWMLRWLLRSLVWGLQRAVRVRRTTSYQQFFQKARWEYLPEIFGFFFLGGAALLVAWIVLVSANRIQIAYGVTGKALCPTEVEVERLVDGKLLSHEFMTDSPCWPTGIAVDAGTRYRIFLEVVEPWIENGRIHTNPLGFESGGGEWPHFIAVMLRRSVTGRWFQPMVLILGPLGKDVQLLSMVSVTEGRYVGVFTPSADGALFLSVNDTMISLSGVTDAFYKNNRGSAKVRIERF